MSDLVFDGARRVVILDGDAEFAKAGTSDDRDVHLHGRIHGRGVLEVVKAGDFANAYGRFVILVHCARERSVTIHNDRYGLVPLYQVVTPDAVYFATRIKSLVERDLVEKTVDYSALSDLLAFNAPLGEKSLVAGISTVPPGVSVHLDLEGRELRREQHWNPADILGEGENLAYGQVKDELISLFLEGYGESVAGKECVGLTLSGGMDSRCILAAAVASNTPLHTYNTSVAGSRSADYAQKMATMCSAVHHFHPVDDEFAATYYAILGNVVDATEAMTLSSEAEAYWLGSHVSGPEIMLHGGCAELSKLNELRTFYIDQKILDTPRSSLADEVWRRFESGFRSRLSLFSGDFKEQIANHARDNLRKAVDCLDDRLGNAEIMQVLYLEELLKLTKYSGHVWNRRVPTDFPFSYPKYVDLLLRVRPQDRLRQQFQIDFLKHTSTQLFEFPNANTGMRVDAPEIWGKVSRYTNFAHRLLSSSKASFDHQDFAGWTAAMKPTPEEVLLEGLDERVFDRDTIVELLERLRGAQTRRGRLRNVARGNRGWESNVQTLFVLDLWKQQMGYPSF